MSLKETLKKVPLLKKSVVALKTGYKELQAIGGLHQERKRPGVAGPIRVGFFCQYIPAWTKVAPIYEMMKADPRFEPLLLCLPYDIQKNDPDNVTENDTYDYFLEQGYSEAINTKTGIDQWLDLKSLKLSYIFYPRPYNALVPQCYNNRIVSRYSRVCMIMYGMATTEEITNITLNRDFMRHTYFYFAETNFAKEINIRKGKLGHKLGLQKTVCIGFPVLEQLAQAKGTESPSWAFSLNKFRVMWTPRWTTAKEEGGSNFFTYYKQFLAYAEAHPEIDFLFRPHPLMFSNFLKTGEMTQQEVDAFKARCEELPNVMLDEAKQYEATLWGSDVLVSDISGIMPEYFTTGKPMIFCATNMELKLAEFCDQMINEGCYTAQSEQELFSCLETLSKGKDPLAEKRKELIPRLFGAAGNNAAGNIVEAIASDAKKA